MKHKQIKRQGTPITDGLERAKQLLDGHKIPGRTTVAALGSLCLELDEKYSELDQPGPMAARFMVQEHLNMLAKDALAFVGAIASEGWLDELHARDIPSLFDYWYERARYDARQCHQVSVNHSVSIDEKQIRQFERQLAELHLQVATMTHIASETAIAEGKAMKCPHCERYLTITQADTD